MTQRSKTLSADHTQADYELSLLCGSYIDFDGTHADYELEGFDEALQRLNEIEDLMALRSPVPVIERECRGPYARPYTDEEDA